MYRPGTTPGATWIVARTSSPDERGMLRGPVGAKRTLIPEGAPGAERPMRSAAVPKFVTWNGRFADPPGATENVVVEFVDRSTRYWVVGPMSEETTRANLAGVGTLPPRTSPDTGRGAGAGPSTCPPWSTGPAPCP